ncbi:MAG: hypothetical protein KA354_11775 [Phycisphaerae bacterium]|nr:hypothetical protein [Phycisphaerae bacterium]
MSEDNSKTALALKIGVIVIAVGAALFLAFRSGDEAEQPDAAEDAMPYICLDDNHVFTLTPKVFQEMSRQGEVKTDGQRLDEGRTFVRCPTTKQFTAVPAIKCPKDGTFFPGRRKDGVPGKCPKCGYAFYHTHP